MPTPTAYTSIERKVYEYKVYDSSGNYLTSWQDVISDLQIDQQINTAGSSVEVTLARGSDSTTSSLDTRITEAGDTRITETSDTRVLSTVTPFTINAADVALNNRVEIWVFYGGVGTRITEAGDTRITETGSNTRVVNDGAVSGRCLFTGYISRFEGQYGDEEFTKITLLSYGAEMANYIHESGSTTTITYNSYDPSNILKDILDKFTSAGGIVDYDSSSVTNTGNVVSYTFQVNTVLEAVQKCLELSPTDWFYRLDMGSNILYLSPRPTNVSHTFILGRHIKNLHISRSLEGLVNKVYFTGGDTGGGSNLYRKTTDSSSISSWRQGLQKVEDSRVTDANSADIIANSIIDRYSTPRYTSEIEILDGSYTIEDIVVGQLIGFSNFNNFIDSLTMQVVAIKYTPESVVLQLDTLLPEMSKRVEDIKRNLDRVNTMDNPTSPS